MTLTVGSLFAGIGGFDQGFALAGLHTSVQVEIDPTCRAVLARHFPDARRHDDVTTADAATLGPVDLLCGGFPCQDVSVAGRRAGLAGARSGLFHEFVRLIDAVRPTWVVIENVPGLLSSHDGRDMGTVLGALGDLGYGWAYRVLDAQYFGVAQRRRRVFIVGHLGDAARAAAVLLDADGGGGDPPPRRGTGQDDPPAAAYSVAVRGREHGQEWELGDPELGNALRAANGGSSRANWTIVPALSFEPRYFTRDNRTGGAPAATVTLTSQPKAGDSTPHVQHDAVVRRLTPTECERLQGFPDGWTAEGADGALIGMSARYRQLGNAVAVPVAEWIGRRIVRVHQGQRGV